jgi:hypothetical protein
MVQLEVKVKCGAQLLPLPLVSKREGSYANGEKLDLAPQIRLVKSEPCVTPSCAAVRYAEVFSDELGVVKGVIARIQVSEKAVPKVCKARPVPHALG